MTPRETGAKIIINADDLGSTAAINREIERYIENGWITSATILANGPMLPEAIKIAKRNPGCSFGVHLNATEFAPVTGSSGWGGLQLGGHFSGRFRRFMRPRYVSRLTEEWSAQIEILLQGGVKISHVDSHHHIHTEFFAFRSLKNVQKTFELSRVRIAANMPALHRNTPRSLAVKQIRRYWSRSLTTTPPLTVTTDYFTRINEFAALAQNGQLPNLRGSTVELMCHPGHELQEFRDENELLEFGLFKYLDLHADLISFNDLPLPSEQATDSQIGLGMTK